MDAKNKMQNSKQNLTILSVTADLITIPANPGPVSIYSFGHLEHVSTKKLEFSNYEHVFGFF